MTPKVTPRSRERLRGLTRADRDDILAAAFAKAIETNAQFNVRCDELPDRLVKLAAQAHRDAEARQTGQPSRYGRARGAVGAELVECNDNVHAGDPVLDVDGVLADLRPDQRAALEAAPNRLGMVPVSAAVEAAARRVIADAATLHKQLEPVSRTILAPEHEPERGHESWIDRAIAAPSFRADVDGEGIDGRWWDRAPLPLTPPPRIEHTDPEVMLALNAIAWSKARIANERRARPEIPAFAFAVPLLAAAFWRSEADRQRELELLALRVENEALREVLGRLERTIAAAGVRSI